MANLDIKISIKKLSDYSASLDKTVEKKTLLLMIEQFSEYLRILYGRLIEEAIYSRRYKGKWEPLDEEGYIEYLGVTPETHILYLIEESLESKKIGYYSVVRFNPSYKYPGTNLPLYRVLRAIDSGTSKFNARPIFKNILKEINTHMIELWKGFLMTKGVI